MENPYVGLNPNFVMPGEDAGLTIFLFGGWGTRKSSVAACFPAPFIISSGNERGDKSLIFLPELYGVPVPPVLPVRRPAEMLQAVDYAARLAKGQGFGTVIIDSLGYYADLWVAHLLETRRNALPRSMTDDQKAESIMMRKQDWGALEIHLIKDVMTPIFKSGLNVIVIVNEKLIMENDERTQTTRVKGVAPYISGATAGKLPGMCDMIIYASKEPRVNAEKRTMEEAITWHTIAHPLNKNIRHRCGLRFPEGKIVDPNGFDGPTFWAFYARVPEFIYVPDHLKQAWSKQAAAKVAAQ